MTSGGRPCTAWTGTGSCGALARLYPCGWRCADHTPARHRLDRPPADPPPADTSPDQTEDTPMIQAALNAAGRGWHVFPLRPYSKRPAFPDHDERHCTRRDPRCRNGHTGWEPRATTDPARIGSGWAIMPYNIGIACGPSRLV